MQIREGGPRMRKTLWPVLMWTDCVVCKKDYRFTRMWIRSEKIVGIMDGINSYTTYFICPNCAHDGIEASKKLKDIFNKNTL